MSEESAPSRSRFPLPLNAWWDYRRKRFWLLIGLAAYTLAGFFLLPWLARAEIEERLQAQLGLPVALADLRTNPWSLTVEAKGFVIRSADGGALVSFERLFVNFQLSSLFRRAFTFREILLDEPYGNLVRRADGSLNIRPLLNLSADDPPVEEADEAEEAEAQIRLLVQDLTVSKGRVDIRDETRATPFDTQVGPIDLEVHELTTLPDRVGNHQISVRTAAGTELLWSGSLQLVPLLSEGRITLAGPYLSLAQQYAQDVLNFELVEGEISGSFDYMLRRQPGKDLEARISNLQWLWSNIALETVGADGQPVRFLHVPSIALEDGTLNWPERTVEAERLVVSNVEVSVWRNADGTLSVDRLLDGPQSGTDSQPGQTSEQSPDRFTSEPPEDAEPVDAAPDDAEPSEANQGDVTPNHAPARASGDDWSLALGAFRVEGLQAALADYAVSREATLHVHDLAVDLQGLSNQPGARFPLIFGLSLAGGGGLKLSGTLGVLPQVMLDADVTVTELALPIAQPWLADLANLKLSSGQLNAQLHVALDADSPLRLDGELEIPGVSLEDTNRSEKLLGWQNLAVDQLSFSAADNSLELSQLDLVEPYGRLHIAEDGTTNYGGLLIEKPQSAPEPPPEERQQAAPLGITVGQVKVNDGSADFTDLSLPLPFRASINEFNGQISTISTLTAQPAAVDLQGRVGEYGLAEVSGKIQPMDPSATTDLRVLFRNVSMPDLTPYTIRFAGRKIDGGSLELDLHYVVDQGKLTGDNGVVINELKLGEKVEHPGALDLPLGLAVALLTGPDGSIDMDMQVTGDVNDPEFGIGGVVLKAFGNMISKVVTAPFNLLGRLVGVDSKDFGRIEFRPGSAALSPPEQEKLLKLAEALALRPNLALTLSGVKAPEVDRARLQERRVESEIEQRIEQLPDDSDTLLMARRRQVLETLVGERLALDLAPLSEAFQRPVDPAEPEGPTALDQPAYLAGLKDRLVEAEVVTEEDLDRLALDRAIAVRDALVAAERVEASRIGLSDPAVVVPDSGWVPMELKVEQASRSDGGR